MCCPMLCMQMAFTMKQLRTAATSRTPTVRVQANGKTVSGRKTVSGGKTVSGRSAASVESQRVAEVQACEYSS